MNILTDYDYDVVIVGAGTAGLSAGVELEKSGISYIILDKKQEIGMPVRSTGAVSLEWVKKDTVGFRLENAGDSIIYQDLS